MWNMSLCILARTGRVCGVKEASVTPCIYMCILLSELAAILIALEFIEKEMGREQFAGEKFFSDSQSVVGLLTLGWTHHRTKALLTK